VSAEEVVATFIAAVERGDVDEALKHVAPECEYDNVPIGKAVGPDAIRQTLAMFVSPENPARFEIVRQAVDGNLVFNERVDHLVIGGAQLDVPVAGVWEVDPATDRITLWRDYFDMGQITSQMGTGS
jgi:limonene-1,2-epoxide hydrolase